MALSGGDLFHVVTETPEQHETAMKTQWVEAWKRELEAATAMGDEARVAAAKAELAHLGVTRETARGPERAVKKPKETR